MALYSRLTRKAGRESRDDFGFGHGQQLLTAAVHKPSEEVFIGGCEVVSERLEMLRDQILPALGLDTDITITGPISDETPEQMFAFLHRPVVMLMNDDRFGPELRETVYAGAAASMPAHSVIYALMPSEQRTGLSNCEEVTGEFSNSWTGYQKPQKLYRRTVLDPEPSDGPGRLVPRKPGVGKRVKRMINRLNENDPELAIFKLSSDGDLTTHTFHLILDALCTNTSVRVAYLD